MTTTINRQNGIHLHVRASAGHALAGHCWIPVPAEGAPADLLPDIGRYLATEPDGMRDTLTVDAATWEAVRSAVEGERAAKAARAAEEAAERAKRTATWREAASAYLGGASVSVGVYTDDVYCGSVRSSNTDVGPDEVQAVRDEHARRAAVEKAEHARRAAERAAKAEVERAEKAVTQAELEKLLTPESHARRAGGFCGDSEWCNLLDAATSAELRAELARRNVKHGGPAYYKAKETTSLTDAQYAVLAVLQPVAAELGCAVEVMSCYDEKVFHGCEENDSDDDHDADACDACTVSYEGRRAIARLKRTYETNVGRVTASARVELGHYADEE